MLHEMLIKNGIMGGEDEHEADNYFRRPSALPTRSAPLTSPRAASCKLI